MWKIRLNDNFVRKLHKHSSKRDVIDGYENAALDLIHSVDPERPGDHKRGSLNRLYGCRITKSYRLLYYVDRSRKEVVMVDLGGHKNVYGRD